MEVEGMASRRKRVRVQPKRQYKKKKFRFSKPIQALTNEPKSFVYTTSAAAMSTADVDLIGSAQLPRGDGPGDREGNRIFVKSIAVMVQTTVNQAMLIRYILYHNKNNTRTACSAAIDTYSCLNYAADWSGFSVVSD